MIYIDHVRELQCLADLVGHYAKLVEATNQAPVNDDAKLEVAVMAQRVAKKVEKEFKDHGLGEDEGRDNF